MARRSSIGDREHLADDAVSDPGGRLAAEVETDRCIYSLEVVLRDRDAIFDEFLQKLLEALLWSHQPDVGSPGIEEFFENESVVDEVVRHHNGVCIVVEIHHCSNVGRRTRTDGIGLREPFLARVCAAETYNCDPKLDSRCEVDHRFDIGTRSEYHEV